MKKIITAIAVILISMTAFSKEYKNPFCNFNYDKTFMLNGGCTISDGFNVLKNEFGDDVITSGFTCGNIGVDIYGVYCDFSFGKKSLGTVDNVEWANDFFSWHVGLDIPLFKWFKITPMFGMATLTNGYYEPGTYSTSYNRTFIKENTLLNTFDYGGKVQFTIMDYGNIYCVLTKYCLSFGIGFTIPLY